MEPEIIFDEQDITKDKPKKKHSLRSKLFFGVFILMAVAAFLLVRPAIIGFSVYDNVKKSGLTVQDYSLDYEKTAKELEEARQKLNSSLEEAARLTDDLGKSTKEIEDVKQENEQNVDLIKEKMGQLTDMQTELSDAKDKVKTLTGEYEELVKNTARSICCKNKIDNENINFL